MASINENVPSILDFSFVFGFETTFDRELSLKWIVDKFPLSIVFATSYLVLIYAGQIFMKNKVPMDLKIPLFAWNAALALFSAFGTFRVMPEFIHAIRQNGLRYSICNFDFYDGSPVTAFWTYVFVMSKIAELFDTAFLVLRKKRVIFLHWFHHCTVLVFTWFALGERSGMGRWFLNMNYVVHTIMYSYYAITALKIRIPKVFSISITVLQVTQMILGIFVSVCSFVIWLKEESCEITGSAAISAILIYLVYGMLFVDFFMKAYILPRFKTKKL